MNHNIPNSVEESSIYREFMAERDEIFRHKWIESEKKGHDIGFDKALMEWIVKYRSEWRKHRSLLMRSI
jgi:hypothetical protein